MATPCFVRMLLVFHLACLAIALPLTDSVPDVRVEIKRDEFFLPDSPIAGDSSHLATEKAAVSDGGSTQSAPDDLSALEQTRKILKLAALLPAETLELLRKIVLPSMNSSIAVPANLPEKAASVPPSNKLHRISSPIRQAESKSHDKIPKSMESLAEAGVELSPGCYINGRQVSCTGKEVRAAVFGLEPSLDSLIPLDAAKSHLNKVEDIMMVRNPENRARESNVLEGSPSEGAIHGTSTSEHIVPENTTSGTIHSEKASKPLVTSKFGNFIFGVRPNDRV